MRITLRDYQVKIMDIAEKAIRQKTLAVIEAPTGTGKTTMYIELANRLKEEGKKVIISTFTNQLALEISSKTNTPITGGIKNYFDPVKLSLMEGLTDLDAVYKYRDSIFESNDFLIASLFNAIHISPFNKIIAEFMIAADKKLPFMHTFNGSNLIITNHSYLLAKLRSDKEFNLSDYILLIDEVDKLPTASDLINTRSFSLFRLQYLAKKLAANLPPYRGSKTDAKQLKELAKTCKKITKLGKDFELENIRNLTKTEISKINLNTERLTNNAKSPFLPPFLHEYSEYLSMIANGKSSRLMLSKQKKFPSFTLYSSNPKPFLNTYLWQRTGAVIGTSATIRSDKTDTDSIYGYIGARTKLFEKSHLGLYTVDAPYTYKAKIYLPDPSMPPPHTNEWMNTIAKTVIETYDNKNSLVLVGSYREVEQISEKILKLKKGIKIIQAISGSRITYIIDEFKQTGGILVAPRPYASGIDLPGKQLERLYIAKVPFPVPSELYWKNLNLFNPAYAHAEYEREAVRAFRQALGRLIRSPEDTGNIYIFDRRIYEHNRENKYKYFIKQYGTIQKETIKQQSNKFKEDL